MSYASALADAQRLKSIMEKHGVACSIELVPDVNGSYDPPVAKRGILSHHTASYARQGLTPLLSLVKKGRSGLPGPLANGYGGRDFVYRILTMGKANHAGLGGPITLAGPIPQNYGNSYLWGTEYEGGYEEWTPEMREFMGRANAALCEFLGGWGASAHGEHKTWTTRKIDRLNYTTQSGREEIVKFGGAPGVIIPVSNNPKPVGSSPWTGKNPNASVANGSRTVRLYDAGSDVKFIQSKVGAKQDGYYGADSVAKTKAWQKANGLVADGIVGPLTWAKLLGSPAKPTSKPGVAAPAFPLPKGSYFGPKSGPKQSVSGFFSYRAELRQWQQRMKDRGWNISVDGLYGDNTAEVARLFQKEKGLVQDSLIGPATWAAAWTAPIT